MVPVWHVGPLAVPVHGVFVALGVLAAMVVFVHEARRRGAVNEQSLVAVAGALVGGAIGMRLSGWARHLDFSTNPSLAAGLAVRFTQHSRRTARAPTSACSIAKRLGGYRGKTGDLFAPAVALGMAIGRIGCHLTEAPGRPTAPALGRARIRPRTPECPGCLAGQAMHPSFLYEIAFQLTAFAVLLWLRRRITRPGRTVRPLHRRLRGVPVPGRVLPGQRNGVAGSDSPAMVSAAVAADHRRSAVARLPPWVLSLTGPRPGSACMTLPPSDHRPRTIRRTRRPPRTPRRLPADPPPGIPAAAPPQAAIRRVTRRRGYTALPGAAAEVRYRAVLAGARTLLYVGINFVARLRRIRRRSARHGKPERGVRSAPR